MDFKELNELYDKLNATQKQVFAMFVSFVAAYLQEQK